MATRVIPTIDGSPSYLEITLRWIDAVGDLRSDVSLIAPGTTDATIEGVVAKMIFYSRASLYTVRVTQVYAGEMSKHNAQTATYLSVQDSIVFHAKNAGRESRRMHWPSPLKELFVPGTETPDPSDGNIISWMGMCLNMWAGSFSGVSLRFTQRRDKNKKVDL